jgi:hypothetical protein
MSATSENKSVATIQLVQSAAPTLNEGALWDDSTALALQAVENGQQIGFTKSPNGGIIALASAITSVTTIQVLVSHTIVAGVLNAATKGFRLKAFGIYSGDSSNAPTLTITPKIGTVSLGTIVSAAITDSAANNPFEIEIIGAIVTTGATAHVMVTGNFAPVLGASTTAGATKYLAQNTTYTSSVALSTATSISLSLTCNTNLASAQILTSVLEFIN